MQATHWCAETYPELSDDEPKSDPKDAALHHLEWNDEQGSDDREELRRQGSVRITVYGYVHTQEKPEEGKCLEWEPGLPWWKPTGESLVVRVRLEAEVEE